MDLIVLICLLFVVPIGLILGVWGWTIYVRQTRRTRELAAAHAAYHAALADLTRAPADPDRRRRALDLGRAYLALTREHRAVTMFDELALSNDISAATAAAAAPAPPSGQLTERLRQLAELRAAGAISEAEYQQRRQAILDSI